MTNFIKKTQQAAVNYTEERTYFLPNHDVGWLDNVVLGSKGDILVIGGTLYGCYLAKRFKVDVVEKSPLAALGQFYVVWLINKGFSPQKIQRSLLLNKFGDRRMPHSRYADYCPEEYQRAFETFLEFLSCDKKQAEGLFQEIFKIERHGDRYGVNLIPKGLSLDGFETQYPLPPMQNLFLENIREFSSKKSYGRVITSNIIDFFEDKNEFLSIVKNLTTPEGFVEVTTYNSDTANFLRGKRGSEASIEGKVGEATLLTKTDEDYFIEYQEDLIVGKNLFLLRPSNL